MKILFRFIFFIFCILFLIGKVNAQENQVLYPMGSEVSIDQDLKDLVWNRYTSKNFVIMSIDEAQGKWMSENIEKIKNWCIERWGFSDFQFSKECRIFCVPNKILFKKLFNIDNSRSEIRYKGDNIEITVIWLVLDDKPARVIPKQLTKICFAEFEKKHNVNLPFFAKNGMSLLNGVTSDISSDINYLGEQIKNNQFIFTSENIFLMTEDQYEKQSIEKKRIFDCQSIVLCLFLRKEFGETKLQGFLRLCSKNDYKDVLFVVYGFTSYRQFDQSYIRYIKDLYYDISRFRTPDVYLEINSISR